MKIEDMNEAEFAEHMVDNWDLGTCIEFCQEILTEKYEEFPKKFEEAK